ncbi:MAG: L-serine ammonia-lyase, iron-sulfur-dependent, subunit alpha [Lachnospiraceae bacterium]|nr:L-serine ammonia-lyase, iron-sulfur-dependent, subunit alpha [Lachnospiraceae bacterium]MDD7668737.1 L-serine ammonia-lyase, iron-sulfur-dependent, subunit alpha [Lachnospiraceae bacterium]MDY2619931.1 L-serine ammonia-lyase, iron-sulfur-dependent, subunit alpha [Agathobacter sp.]
MTEYHTLQELQELAVHQKKEIWQIVQQEDMDASERTQEQSYEKMHQMYEAMKYADASYNGNLRSASGRAGGDGEKLHQYNASGKNICGAFIGLVMEKAIKMGESNACMRRIVAAPTAGSCGVLPAVLLSFEEQFSATEEQMVQALYVAAGIGKVIAENAFIAGAAGGCQAEIGSAAAMSAGALAYLQGADPQTVMHAAALSLKNMLGLACDPVGGLVEVPCIKRNSYGAVNAVTSAQLALAGIRSAITPDDVIDSMRRIGNQMPTCLKETSEGGLATSASAEVY